MTVQDRVGTCNAYVILTDRQAEQLLRGVLRNLQPELLGVNEWDGPKPTVNPITKARAVDNLLQRVTDATHHRFARPRGGGNPVVWNTTRYRLVSIDAVQLVGRGFVGRLPGRKTTLPASSATVAVFDDLVLDEQVTLIVFHLTAEVQYGAGYRRTLSHRLRVMRHRRERRALSRLVRAHQRRGRVYATGDTNFDGMTLPPLIACWVGHKRAEAAGTLGHRTVDFVYAPDRARDVQTLNTRSDHDAVVAIYRRREAS